MSTNLVKGSRPALKEVKKLLSASPSEAKQRVLHLYKLWYRQAPQIGWFSSVDFIYVR